MKPARNHGSRAFTLVELFICIAVFAVLVVLFLPGYPDDRVPAKRVNCTNNLKQIAIAFRTWELDHNDELPVRVSLTNGGIMELPSTELAYLHFRALSNELSTPKILVCPADSGRAAGANFATDFSNQKLSYFVGLDAAATNSLGFLSGDRNITNANGVRGHVLTLTTNFPSAWTTSIHSRLGNVALADGSVQGLTTRGLQGYVAATGMTTNRLAMP
jgi:prepilin-type processing-associated H-X9-DG protein